MQKNLAILVAAILIAAVSLTISLIDLASDDEAPKTSTVTVTVPAAPPATAVDADGDGKRDDALPLDADAQKQLEQGPPARSELDEPLRAPNDTGPAGVLEGPLAADDLDGCRTRFVQNFSSRNGVRPRIIVWHQTVSRENGVSSQNALTAFANRRSSGVSWTALVGRSNGLCTYTVPAKYKPWTQGNANPFSLGIEVEAYGDETTYVTGAGRAKLLSVTRQLARRYGIPLQRGRVQNCRPVRSGIVEHYDLGACGGGHVDVASSRWQRNPSGGELAGWNITPLIAELARSGRPVTSTDRITCRKLNAWRNAGRPRGGQWERNSVRRRKALDTREVTCTAKGPVRR